jgi:hypothetical protein
MGLEHEVRDIIRRGKETGRSTPLLIKAEVIPTMGGDTTVGYSAEVIDGLQEAIERLARSIDALRADLDAASWSPRSQSISESRLRNGRT